MIATPSMLDDTGQPRQDVIARTVENAGDDWKARAHEWITSYLEEHPFLRPGDAQHCGCPAPATTWRAMGGIYQWAIFRGLMVEDGTVKRPNGTKAARYRSLIWKGAAA